MNFFGAALVGNGEVSKVAFLTSVEPPLTSSDLMRSLAKKAVWSSAISKAVLGDV